MSSRSTSAPTARPYGRYPPAPEDEPEPAEVTYSRGLPSFGNPNQLRNPPSHYFPSVPASQRKLRRQRSPEPASQQEPVRPSDSSPSNADQPPYDAPSDRADSGEPEDRDEDVEMDVDDDGVKDDAGAAVGGKEEAGPAKKRSRTLTTAHQTAVLNALLAKTRFPSTETREEVGQQIGMSARRVQIWFQNRRQSQKRARDREASEIGGPHPGSQPHSDFLSSDPYSAARYNQRAMPHGQGHSLSRQTSIESMASIASFSSAQTSMSAAARQQYPDRSRPGPSNGYTPYPALSQHWSTGSSAGLPGPVRTYAFPPMPPSKRIDRSYRYRSPEPEVKLPPLMSMLGQPPTGNESPQQQYPPAPPSPTSNVFSHRPPPLTTQRSFNSDRTAQPPSEVASPSSSSTTLPRFDHTEFSRLRISNPPSRYPDDMPQGLDVLDEAMETVYRSARVNPPRASLPPLRSTFSELRHLPPIPQRAAPASEADAALLAPILKTNNASSSSFGKGTRLPPLSSLSLSSASSASSSATIQPQLPHHSFPPISSSAQITTSETPVFPHRGSTFSQTSSSTHSTGTHQTPARSSISSFDTTWPPSIASSRTSFSSEVQEEWERASAALGGGMSLGGRKGPQPTVVREGREGSWEYEQERGQLKSPEEVRSLGGSP